MDTNALTAAKLHIPPVRAGQVPRPELLTRLDAWTAEWTAGSSIRFVLVSAAAGMGKTALIADWARHSARQMAHMPGAVAWVSLDSSDDDPAHFDALIKSALEVETQVLVLDDYHTLENPLIHQTMTMLTPYTFTRGGNLRCVVLITRADPPLPLAYWRADGTLLEIRDDDLRFTPEQTDQFLRGSMALPLTPEQVDALTRRTEGWIAGLQLAALALKGKRADAQWAAAFVREFTGTHRYISDYLIDEVLAVQPDDVRAFLLHTSILDRMNAGLCAALTGIADSQSMLETLEKRNLFVVPLDQVRGWYRYHHLFAELLRARLTVTESPEAIRDLNRQAAAWHESNAASQNGLPEAAIPEGAIPYALAAGDFDSAARLMTGAAVGVMRRGDARTLLDWYARFPVDYTRAHPRLGLQFGMAFAMSGQWKAAHQLLTAVESALGDDSPPEEALLLEYLIASYQRDEPRLQSIQRRVEQIDQPNRIVKLVLALLIALKGDLDAACEMLKEVQAESDREGDPLFALGALCHRARLTVHQGKIRHAYGLSVHAVDRLAELGTPDVALPMMTFPHLVLGRVYYEWNDLDQAEHHLNEASRLARDTGFVTGILSSAQIIMAEVKWAAGDAEAASACVYRALALARQHDPPSEIEWLKAYGARMMVLLGDLPRAKDWLRNMQARLLDPSVFYPHGIMHVARARLLIAEREADEAAAILTKHLIGSPDMLTVEAWTLLALARQMQGDSYHAHESIGRALVLANQEDRIRVFFDAGAGMARLLAKYTETHPTDVFAVRVMHVFAEQPAADIPDMLTEREIDILRLIAAGYTNDQIAEELVLAVSTIKWYINQLYGKLGVKTRTQAVAKGRELGVV